MEKMQKGRLTMDMVGTAPWWVSVWPLINLILLAVISGASIYGFFLFVKFTRLGIKAFSIYIEKNKNL